MKIKGLNSRSLLWVLYGFLGFIVLLTLAAGVFLTFKVNKLSLEVAKNRYLSINNNRKIEALANLQKDLKEMSDEKKLLDNYLPKDKEVSSILKDFEILSGVNGLNFNIFTAGGGSATITYKPSNDQTQKSGDYYVFPFQMTVDGSFTRIDLLMRGMEGYKRLVEIKSIKYTKDVNAPGDATEAVLQVNAYLKK